MLLGLLAGLLGGAAGALAVRALAPAAPAVAAASSDAVSAARLERIERTLTDLAAARGPQLEGRRESNPGGAGDGESSGHAERLLSGSGGEAFRQALREELTAALDTRIEALKQASKPPEGAPPAPKKRRVELSEAAKDLGLTGNEESELRRIYAESEEKMLKVVAGPDGDVEAVRKDMEEAKRDPKKRATVMLKYMPKVLPRIGDFMTVEMEKQAAIEATLGPEKAGRLESDFDVVEGNPFGGDNQLRVEARAGNR